MIPESKLAEIEARANAATPGPWIASQLYSHRDTYTDTRFECIDIVLSSGERFPFVRPEEAYFIAHARQDIPALLAEVRRLRAVVEVYADRTRWVPGYYSGGVLTGRDDLWVEYNHGYTRAEECLREDGE